MFISRDLLIQLHWGMVAVYLGLGAACVVWPRPIARFFYLPRSTPQSLQAREAEILMPSIGLRDITVGLVLWVALARKDYDMATMTVFAGQLPMVYDTIVAFRDQTFFRGLTIAYGSASWGLTSYALRYWT